MYQAVEDSVPHGGIADQLVPALHRVLTGDQVGAGALTVIEDLEEEAVLVGFEGCHTPVIDDQQTETAPEQLHLWANPEPLFQTDPVSRGAVTQCDAWPQLWEEIKTARPSLVIVDPVSAALADADTSQTGPARTFLRLLSQEAATAGCGVLLVAHDTKSARNLAMAGQNPGAGAVAGSAAWYDGTRGVLTLVPDPAARDSRLLVAIKANYGRTGWGALLTERCEAGKFRGLELRAQMDAAEVNHWREGVEANPAKRPSGRAEAGSEGVKPGEVLK